MKSVGYEFIKFWNKMLIAYYRIRLNGSTKSTSAFTKEEIFQNKKQEVVNFCEIILGKRAHASTYPFCCTP
jgi:hypothetical protein